MKNTTKNYCEVHHLTFRGTICPCCESDRVNAMAHRLSKKHKKTDKTNNENHDWSDLESLGFIVTSNK